MPAAELQANIANQRIKSQLRRLPVYSLLKEGKDAAQFLQRRRIFKLHPQSADEHIFSYQGRDISVTDYYREKYNVRLVHHSSLPLVDVAVQPAKPTLIPMELCFIEAHLCTAAQLLACRGRNEVPADVTTAILRVSGSPFLTSLLAGGRSARRRALRQHEEVDDGGAGRRRRHGQGVQRAVRAAAGPDGQGAGGRAERAHLRAGRRAGGQRAEGRLDDAARGVPGADGLRRQVVRRAAQVAAAALGVRDQDALPARAEHGRREAGRQVRAVPRGEHDRVRERARPGHLAHAPLPARRRQRQARHRRRARAQPEDLP